MLNIYKASAGSGKTFKLTKEYLRLLLGEYNSENGKWALRKAANHAHRHILAITFTNKATQEMTQRIIKQLAILGGREGANVKSPYLDEFVKFFHSTPDNIQKLASEILEQLLFDFAYFHVSTIDAFFQNVLRVFAREVELPDNFELELDSNYAINLGVNEMFTSLNYGEPDEAEDIDASNRHKWLTESIERYMTECLEQGKAINMLSRQSSVYGSLVKTFSALLNEDYKLYLKELSAYFKDTKKMSNLERAIKEHRNRLGRELKRRAEQISAYSDFESDVKSTIRGVIAKAKEGAEFNVSQTIIDAADGSSNTRFRKGADAKHDGDDLDKIIKDFCSIAKEQGEANEIYKVLLKALLKLGLLASLQRFLEDYCKDNNLILLADTNSLLKGIINDDDTPFIYERIGYYLHNFLIDEFQDTSKMQWDILKPLVMESLSNANQDLIIGDEKQCIYRFRNSEPELLGSKVADSVEKEVGYDSTNIEGNSIDENKNWRSTVEVVKFNNSLFHALAKVIDDTFISNLDKSEAPAVHPNKGDADYREDFDAITDDGVMSAKKVYQNIVQGIDTKRLGEHGHVELILIEKLKESKSKGDKKAKSATASIDDEGNNSDDGSQSPADDTMILPRVADTIDGYLNRGYRAKDICILVRTHNEGKRVIDYLMKVFNGKSTGDIGDPSKPWAHGKIGITSADSLSVDACPTIKMLIDLLRLTLMPRTVTKQAPKRNANNADEVETIETVNPEYLRTRLTQLYEYYRHSDISKASKEADGATLDDAKITEICSEALNKATEIIRKAKEATKDQPAAELLNRLDQDIAALIGDRMVKTAEGHAKNTSLDAEVERLIGSYVSDEALERDTIYLMAFQDIVQDFCSRGKGDIRSFLDWWDKGGNNTGLSSTADTDAISVMTIHQSKGLEFPCVIVPYANWDLVKYHSHQMQSLGWYRLRNSSLPKGLDIDPNDIPGVVPLEFVQKLQEISAFARQACENATRQAIDNLNVAYVALTRAIAELTVISCYETAKIPAGKKTGKPKLTKLGHFIEKALEELTEKDYGNDLDNAAREWVEPLKKYAVIDIADTDQAEEAEAEETDADDSKKAKANIKTTIIELGKPTERQENDKKSDEAIPIEAWPLQAYEPARNDRHATLSKSDVDLFDIDDPRHRGIFLHKVMSNIRHKTDMELSLKRAAYRARLDEEKQKECLEMLTKIFSSNDEHIELWFGSYRSIANERTLFTGRDNLRPDRIVWTADKHVDVIDYKFGTDEPKKYRDQVERYCKLLEQSGESNVRGYLWHPLEGKIEQVK